MIVKRRPGRPRKNPLPEVEGVPTPIVMDRSIEAVGQEIRQLIETRRAELQANLDRLNGFAKALEEQMLA